MHRNIVVLADGTGNSASKAFKTNVWRLYQALDLTGSDQIAVFSDGVGTSQFRPFAVIGSALGFGVKRRVLALYKFLCMNYQEGDRIYTFGFSRGAFIIRLLVGLVAREGLVEFKSQEELDRNALAAYRAFRRKAFPDSVWLPWVWLGRNLRDRMVRGWNWLTGSRSYEQVQPQKGPRSPDELTIRFLGVWDTVAAYGLPVDELTKAVNACIWPMIFTNKSLLECVEHARQAFSIDDERRTFFPIRWDETESTPNEKAAKRSPRLLQVWFAGSHSNVGGGYPDDRLAHIPLCWMIGEAAETGLVFNPDVVADYWDYASENGRIYDSRSGVGLFYRYHPRPVADLIGRVTPVVHSSVLLRMNKGADGYAPISLPKRIDVLMPLGQRLPFTTWGPDVSGTARKKGRAVDKLPLPSGRQRDLGAMDAEVADAMQKLRQGPGEAEHSERVNLLLDTVWWRRGLYYATLILVVLAAAFPFLAGYVRFDDADKVGKGVVGPVVGLFEGFLPRFAGPWLNAITQHSAGAAVLAAAIVFCIWLNNLLRQRIQDRSREAWNVAARKDGGHLEISRNNAQRRIASAGVLVSGLLALMTFTPGEKMNGASRLFAWVAAGCLTAVMFLGLRGDRKVREGRPFSLLGFARLIRTNPLGIKVYYLLKDYILPGVFLAASIVLVLAAVNKVAFETANSAGAFCETSPGDEPNASEKLTAAGPFPINALCWDSGIRLEERVTYRVVLSIPPEDTWKDDTICTDTRGFSAGWAYSSKDKLSLYPGTLLKRWWGQPWFKPIARVGQRGNDEYVLEPVQPSFPPACSNSTLVAHLTPKTSGELYLYVNDAAFALPGLIRKYYANNHGFASLTVERLKD
ncbi:MAG: DUF2235 domain-containing protein [Mesorhizobium sp.]|jgi:uncharacterized protein (DUF2235 family)